MFEVLAKGLGKNVDEATVKTWFFEEGDSVTEGDDLVELAMEDASITITAPVSGILTEVCIDEDETVQRDEVLCIIDDEEGDLSDGEDEEEGETKEE
ncbi:MAG TPA: biotin/lipoyl-binding protein [Candidatus Omnitrophota bacterium]|nr:biotin/lipoyl-binding protein [Candidatus Omnitrophota bacterium]HRY86081.1 biotin/lipoyl-binding protein [Candidatus Omnitrophota bacterium]